MSDRQPTELASHYLYVTVDNLFASRNNTKITVRVNNNDPEIVTLIVAGLQISTVRDNWKAIFNEFATVLTSELEAKVPARTFRLDFNDGERTLKVVPE
jgi:hypothetical protein